MREPLVTGDILIPTGLAFTSKSVVYVRLLDTSLADAPATIIAEQVIADIAGMMTRGEQIEFALYGEIQNQRASYSVSVHLDMDGDGRISKGDYINTQNYPVITFGFPKTVKVKIVMIG